MGSAELLESSSALHPSAQQQLLSAAELFEQVMSESGEGGPAAEERAFEELTNRCQAIVSKEGGLHLSAVAPVTRDGLPRLGLRGGWRDLLQALAERGVPTYIFSSGYGDVVAQALLLGGLGALSVSAPAMPSYSPHSPAAAAGGSGQLPQNLRIISNFFRAAPDGTVRAFSQPVVHERNKNATTAARVLGMPLPQRPYALLLAAHEDDATSLLHGLSPSSEVQGEGVRESLSVGFLELGEDLPHRLPSYLAAFDAVVLGDGSLHFARGLVEDLLDLPHSVSGLDKQAVKEGAAQGGLLGAAGLLRKNLFEKFLGQGQGQGQVGEDFGPDASSTAAAAGGGGGGGAGYGYGYPPVDLPGQGQGQGSGQGYAAASGGAPSYAPPPSSSQGQRYPHSQDARQRQEPPEPKSYLHYGDY